MDESLRDGSFIHEPIRTSCNMNKEIRESQHTSKRSRRKRKRADTNQVIETSQPNYYRRSASQLRNFKGDDAQ